MGVKAHFRSRQSMIRTPKKSSKSIMCRPIGRKLRLSVVRDFLRNGGMSCSRRTVDGELTMQRQSTKTVQHVRRRYETYIHCEAEISGSRRNDWYSELLIWETS